MEETEEKIAKLDWHMDDVFQLLRAIFEDTVQPDRNVAEQFPTFAAIVKAKQYTVVNASSEERNNALDKKIKLKHGEYDWFIIAFILVAYKRFDDLLTDNQSSHRAIVKIPESYRWSNLLKQKSHYFLWIDKSLKELGSVNKNLAGVGDALNFARYDKIIPLAVQKKVIKFVSNIDLSKNAINSAEDLSLTKTIFSWAIDSWGLGSFVDKIPYSVCKMAVKLLDLNKDDLFYAPACDVGDIFIAAIEQLIEKEEISCKAGRSVGDGSFISSLKFKGDVALNTTWALAVLRLILAGADIAIKNEDYLEKEVLPRNHYETIFGPIVEERFNFDQAVQRVEAALKNSELDINTAKTIKNSFLEILTREQVKDNKPSAAFLNLSRGLTMENPSVIDVFCDSKKCQISKEHGEFIVLLHALNAISKKGRLAVVLPVEDLSAKDTFKIRKFLVERDYIEGIIDFNHSYHKSFALLILNKSKTKGQIGKIIFTRADYGFPLCLDDWSLFPEIKHEIDRIVKLFNTLNENPNFDYVAEIKALKRNKYNLHPTLYAGRRNKKVKKLSDIAEIIVGKYKEEGIQASGLNASIIQGGNLSEDMRNTLVKLDSHNTIPVKRLFKRQFFSQKSILVSLGSPVGWERQILPERSSCWNPTIFDPARSLGEINNNHVLLSDDIAAIIPKKTIDIDYLYYQLYSSDVRWQLEANYYFTSDIDKQKSINNLKSIIIGVHLTKEEQIDFLKMIKDRIIRNEMEENEELRKAFVSLQENIHENRQEAEFSIVRHLAHNIKPKIQGVKSPIKSIRDFLKEKEFLGEVLSKRLDGSMETVDEALHSALKNLDQIYSVVDTTRQFVVREIKREDFDEVDIYDLFEKEIKMPNRDKPFDIHIKTIPYNSRPKIRLHRESFIEAMNNIIRNAEMHAFIGSPSGAKLEFNIKVKNNDIIIDYTNNGKPLPKNMKEEDLLAYGKKGRDSIGEGLGGAWIGKVIEAHAGKFEIIPDDNPIHFRITLPKEIWNEQAKD